MKRGGPPDDFAGFVDTHHGRLAQACQRLAGPMETVLARELLALVALHWWWLRRWPPSRASAYLDRLVRREARACGADLDRSKPPEPYAGPPSDRLARDAWQQAGQLRRRGRGLVAVLALGLCAAVLIAPKPTAPSEPGPTPRPGPTAVPAGVTIVPTIERLLGLAAIPSPIPQTIRTDQVPGRFEPGAPAVATLQTGAGDLLIVRRDGVQRVNDARLSTARLLTTSLSPDGERVALVGTGVVLVLGLDTGRVREFGAGLIRADLTSLVWLSDRMLLLPGAQGGSWQVDVDTGRTTELAGITGADVATIRG
ncbi:MAG TPA: hypothetical protein VF163_01730, partial [Micromonosporaceae bacterium]